MAISSENYTTLTIIVIALWTIPWKGWALWISARNKDRAWFVVLLVINTVAILDIFYIFIFSKRKKKGKIEEAKEFKETRRIEYVRDVKNIKVGL